MSGIARTFALQFSNLEVAFAIRAAQRALIGERDVGAISADADQGRGVVSGPSGHLRHTARPDIDDEHFPIQIGVPPDDVPS